MGGSQHERGNGQTILSAAMLIAVLSFASRLLGLFRDRILAGTFGAGEILDAYYTAFRVPDFLFNLLGLGALSAAFLPVFLRYRRDASSRQAFAYAATILSDLAIMLLVVCGMGVLFAPPLFRLLAPGFTTAQLTLTVAFGRVLFGATFLLGVSTVAGGVLQAEKRFLAFAIAPLLYNAGIILGVVIVVPIIGPMGIAWGVVVGAVLHLIVQWAAARRLGLRFRFHPSVRDVAVRDTARLLLPRMLGLASQQVQLVVIASIASTLAAGTLTAFTFAYNIQMVPVALVGVSFAIAAFPHFTEAVRDGMEHQFRSYFSSSVRQIALLAFPAVVLLLALKAQIVRVLLGSGAFDWQDTIMTFHTLEAFGIGLFWAMIIPLLTRAFYAYEDTRTPFVIGLVADALAIVAAWTLGRSHGPRGLAFAMVIALTVQAVLLIAALRMRTGPLDGRRTVTAMMKFGLAAFAMGVVIQLVKPGIAYLTGTDTFFGVGLQGAVAGALGFATYLAMGSLLRSEEIASLARALRHRVFRTITLLSGADEARG